jgi:SAM-dependent methyltransferase
MVGKAVWGSGFGPLYDSLAQLGALPSGTRVLDVACGAGLALRYLDPGVRYVGVDHSPSMLQQARRSAQHRGFAHVELHLADVGAMPVPDAAADVGLLYNSLHCFTDPQAALADMVRCLRPNAAVHGSMLVREAVPRADRLLEKGAVPGGMVSHGGSTQDLRRWLDHLADVEVSTVGALAVFKARVPTKPAVVSE